MITMQYNIKLPADYDMDIIKTRVKENGFKTDGFKGLGMKAYLIAEKNKYGNTQNEYAPFYFWNQIEGMNEFLLGGPFNNILKSFGWTIANTWEVLHSKINKVEDIQYAIIKKARIMPRDNFKYFLEEQTNKFEQLSSNNKINSCIVSYNPTTWELCTFLLSSDFETIKLESDESLIYKSYHIS